MNPDIPEPGDELFVCPVCRWEAWGDWERALEISEQPFVCPACGDSSRGSWRSRIRGFEDEYRRLEQEKDAKILKLEGTIAMLVFFLFVAVSTIAARGC